MRKSMLAIAAGLAAGIAAVAVLLAFDDDLLARLGFPGGESRAAPSAALEVAGADIGGPFELTSHEGVRVRSEELIDGPTLIYFGYTYCPDVCPVDVSEMAQATDLLAERGIEVTPVFITIDPARDDQEVLGYFADAMHPDMVALTGSAEAVRQAADAYRVYYARAGDEPEGYLMNHSAFTYLMTPDGLQAIFRREATAEDIADEAERVLEG